jgi:cytochrome c biogenesis protein CcdA
MGWIHVTICVELIHNVPQDSRTVLIALYDYLNTICIILNFTNGLIDFFTACVLDYVSSTQSVLSHTNIMNPVWQNGNYFL